MDAKQPKVPATFAGGAGIGVGLAVYLGHRYGLDPETVTLVGSVLSALVGFAVHWLNRKYPTLVNVAERALNRDLDGDSDVGK